MFRDGPAGMALQLFCSPVSSSAQNAAADDGESPSPYESGSVFWVVGSVSPLWSGPLAG
jgi:hypothetical protein